MVSTSLISCSSFVSIYITIVTMVSQEGSCILTGIVESVVCWKEVPVHIQGSTSLPQEHTQSLAYSSSCGTWPDHNRHRTTSETDGVSEVQIFTMFAIFTGIWKIPRPKIKP